MLLYSDGYDHYAATNETASNITALLQAAGYTVANGTNTTLQFADGQDVGSKGLKLTVVAGSGTPASVSKQFNSTADHMFFGFSFRGTGTRQRIARINGAVDLLWDVDTGKLKIGTTQGADVIIQNAFWFLEIEIDKADNKVRVWANDTPQLEVDLPAGAITTSHTIQFGLTGASANAATLEYDDFYVVDSSGGVRNDRLGPVQCITRAPTTDALPNDWTAVGSSGTHASIVAQLSPNAGSAPYLQANIAAKEDNFTSNTVLPNDNQIFGVQLVSYSRKGDLDDRQLGMTIETAGGKVETPIALTTTFAFRTAMFEQAPGGVDWNQNRVESSEFGIIAR